LRRAGVPSVLTRIVLPAPTATIVPEPSFVTSSARKREEEPAGTFL
jgi:hypothetical protein